MKIILFGISKEIIGNNQLTLPEGHGLTTVLELKKWLLKKYPVMGSLSAVAIAVDQVYAEDETPISDNQEIALIPPVSGG
ncbi:molybdopterin converting factor subunit 1 [Negadavirga shengliensis]|uniref:Molybdopterin synthase sulfur carrier subunit n=1 Tax=Negadavirga shengliensis TaxID=1389218 RepID=A0ABV9T5I8_9BACT